VTEIITLLGFSCLFGCRVLYDKLFSYDRDLFCILFIKALCLVFDQIKHTSLAYALSYFLSDSLSLSEFIYTLQVAFSNFIYARCLNQIIDHLEKCRLNMETQHILVSASVS